MKTALDKSFGSSRFENRKPKCQPRNRVFGFWTSDFEFFIPWIFAAAIFLGAGQLFLLEPMLAKMLLPSFGGAPAVWLTCVVFFQVALLAGYVYVHILTSRLPGRLQVVLHLALLITCFAFLPISIPDQMVEGSSAQPVFSLLGILVLRAGLPFLMVSSTAPLVQRWFATGRFQDSHDPYYFYAASNAGSLLALLAYPIVVEPNFSLPVQSGIWLTGFGLWSLLLAVCGAYVWWSRNANPKAERQSLAHCRQDVKNNSLRSFASWRESDPSSTAIRISFLTRGRWLILAFVPSSLMLGCTSYLSADVASFPLLWVVPLALYLLSFVFVFSRGIPTWVHGIMVWTLPGVIGVLLASEGTIRLGTMLGIHLTTLFVASMVCHGELARSRPPAERLTEFYLWIAVGGALGSCFNALLAPLVFSWVAEYPLALALAVVLLPPLFPLSRNLLFRFTNRAVPIALGCVVGVVFLSNRHQFVKEGLVVQEDRTFFGVYRLVRDDAGKTCVMMHGQIWQGMQFQSDDPRERRFPLLYYFSTSPIGQVFYAFHGPLRKDHVGVIGLGIGNLAGYAEPGQEFTFYEIDPAVTEIARNPRYFNYLADAEARGAKIRVVHGDGRLALESESTCHFGMIVLDAFSGDAIPTHLLTREAFQLYMDRLDEDGLLALQITNDHANLEPIVAELALDQELFALVQEDGELSVEERERGKAPSKWVVLAHRPEDFGRLAETNRWRTLKRSNSPILWRDDFTNLLPILRW